MSQKAKLVSTRRLYSLLSSLLSSAVRRARSLSLSLAGSALSFRFLSRFALFCTYALRFNSFLLVFRFRRLGIVRSVVRAKRRLGWKEERDGHGARRCRSMNNERQCKAKRERLREGERNENNKIKQNRVQKCTKSSGQGSKAEEEKEAAAEKQERYNFFPCWQPKAKREERGSRRGGVAAEEPPSRF